MLLKDVAQKIGVRQSEVDIHRAQRLQNRRDGQRSTILVQIMSASKRDEWLRAGRRAEVRKSREHPSKKIEDDRKVL
ncbi:hypothetical protein J6590_078358, partial [Homalodisca vitripennis]